MRNLVVLPLLLAAGTASADFGDVACWTLGETVYRHVAAAGYSSRLAAATPEPVSAPVECRDTARVVSKAFTRAMAERDLYITWLTPERQRGDACLSRDLAQCYPDQDPLVPLFSVYDAAFVARQWRAVRAAVSAAMPAGTESDVVRFDPEMVGYRLRARLPQGSSLRRLLE